MKKKAPVLLIIIGFCALTVGITLIVLGCTVLSYYPFGDEWFGKTPQPGALAPGVFLCFISIPLLVIGFVLRFAKPNVKIESKIIESASKTNAATAEKSCCSKCGAPITRKSDGFCEFCGTRL